MTLAGLTRRLKRAGARVELVDGRVVVKGWQRLSRHERELVAHMRAQVEAMLREPLDAVAPGLPKEQQRQVVGQQRVGGRWVPIYADPSRPLGSVLLARKAMFDLRRGGVRCGHNGYPFSERY